MDRSTTQIIGMRELMLAMRVMAPQLAKDLRVGLKAITDEIANVARVEAAAQGFAPPGTSGRGTGLLIGSIRSGVNLKMGWIKDTAHNPRDGYGYPARYEYEKYGLRSFLHPAIDKNRDKIYASLVAVVDATLERFGTRG